MSEKRIGFADHFGTVAEIAVLDDDGEDDPTLHFSLSCGGSSTRGIPTAEAARQIAAALLDAADAVQEGER